MYKLWEALRLERITSRHTWNCRFEIEKLVTLTNNTKHLETDTGILQKNVSDRGVLSLQKITRYRYLWVDFRNEWCICDIWACTRWRKHFSHISHSSPRNRELTCTTTMALLSSLSSYRDGWCGVAGSGSGPAVGSLVSSSRVWSSSSSLLPSNSIGGSAVTRLCNRREWVSERTNERANDDGAVCGVNKVMAVVKGELPGSRGARGPFLGIWPEFRGKRPAAGRRPIATRIPDDSPGFYHRAIALLRRAPRIGASLPGISVL